VSLLVGVGLIFLINGCNSGDPARQEITGTVTLKNRPVEEGIIRFEPMDNQPTGDGATITKGEYRIPRKQGMYAGRYRVEIYLGDGSSGAGNADPSGGRRGPGKGIDLAPPEYNTKSKQIVTVTDEGPNRFDFHIP
jgi:murein DD-endopeptidase MepM/ murein hydrolase activator NlpD